MNNLPSSVQEFLGAYRYKIELHAHTSPASMCSEFPPEEFIKRLKSKGYDAVCVTNHFYRENSFMKSADPVGTYMEDFYRTRELGEKEGIRVLLGTEIRFSENSNDYLVFGIDEAFLREAVHCFSLTFEEFYERYKHPDRLIVQAHPFRGYCVPMSGKSMDAMEVFNMHPTQFSFLERTSCYAKEQGIPIITIGTDLHHEGHEGTAALRAKYLPADSYDLVRLLRSQDYLFEIAGRPLLPYYTF